MRVGFTRLGVFLRPGILVLGLATAASPVLTPAPARADSCLADGWYDGVGSPGRNVFPNWYRTFQGSFTLLLVLAQAGTEQITGLTIVNFGTANGTTDVTGVYARFFCAAHPNNDTGIFPLTYAGVYAEDSGNYPAWTWTGPTTDDFSGCNDACGTPACGAGISMYLYADIGACPTPDATVCLGLPSNVALDVNQPGSITDNEWCMLPWGEGDINRGADLDTIAWAYKDGPDTIAPGDTITYTLFYGLPGSSPLTGILINDTLPMYTHYLANTSTPVLPVSGWDPYPGPPQVLQWNAPGGATTGGPTRSLTYQVSVDWGNGEVFEPGSGDVAAPEAGSLYNNAVFAFQGTTCALKALVTNTTRTVVARFLFWKTADNDVLFASSLGQPPDEMVYSIYMKNLSYTKTWWNVFIWDTVPAQIDAWCAGCGVFDPCVGWTMTPSGCAAASPGVVVTGAKTTLLTWKLDMPPQFTLNLQFKGQVRATIPVGQTAVNQAMIKGLGQTGIIGGTGDTGPPRVFTHLAMIILRTTYVSYVGYAGATDNRACPGFLIDFFPLNKQSQFELRGIEYANQAWSNAGGVSDPIGCFIGDCINGYPGAPTCTLGDGAIGGGGIPGCKAERIPSTYDPTIWQGTCPPYVFNFIYKITSNSPVVWQLVTHINNCNQDRHTYAPSTNLSYTGYTLYTWRGDYADGSSFGIINTGMNPYGAYQARPTTTHLFQFDFTQNLWVYRYTFDLDVESLGAWMGSCPNNAQPCADTGAWRFISSDNQLIVHVGEYAFNTAGCCCCSGADNHGAYAPMRETGYVTGSGNFYGICEPQGCGSNNGLLLISSAGGAASYNIWKYTPLSTVPSAGSGGTRVPPLLRGSSGTWAKLPTPDAVSANNALPPVTYNIPTPPTGNLYNSVPFKRGGSNLFKIEVVSGGPIQILHGTDMFSQWSGGAVLHASSGQPAGPQFWHTQTEGRNTSGTLVAQVFHPKSGVSIRATTNNGYSARYTTNASDECVAFLKFTVPTTHDLQTIRLDVVTGQAAIAEYQCNQVTEKGFTAPFLASGEHYMIIAPPVVYVGQQFWITVQVVSGLGGLDTSYTGTTSFTSTDQGALIEGKTMDAYNYTWQSGDNGQRIFFNMTFTRIGTQTLVASDLVDGSITGITAILVVGADVRIFKNPPFSIAASGDTVQFRICWSNYSSASAFTFVLTDAMPRGMTYLPEVLSALDCGSTDGVAYAVAYSTVQQATPPAAFTTLAPGASPPAATSWLRWTYFMAGVQTTGCACFRVVVN